MTDLATQLRGSVQVQEIVQDMIDDANAMLKSINDLYNTPTDEDAFIRTFRSCARITAALGELNALVKHDFG
jgi:hypothetical protein